MKRSVRVLVATLIFNLGISAAEAERMKPVIRVGERPVSAAVPGTPGVLLRLHGVTFDPVAAVPDYSSVGLSSRPSSEYGLVQLDPDVPGARQNLVAAGVRLIGYVPDHAFRVRLDERTREALRSTEGVRWFGPYLPGYKVHSTLWAGSEDSTTELVITLFPGEDPSGVAPRIEALAPGIDTVLTFDDDWLPLLRVRVPLAARIELIGAVAEQEAVAWIEPWREARLDNNHALGPVQGGVAGEEGRTIFARGLTGTGQIVAVADTGVDVDMCFFRSLNGNDAVTLASQTIAPEIGPLFPDNKVIAYWVQEHAQAYEEDAVCPPTDRRTNYHGTHVAATVLGDDPATPSSASDPGIDPGDGMAPNAQLLFQDAFGADGCSVFGRVAPSLMFEQAYRGGARLHNDSWGALELEGYHSWYDAPTDRFLFENPDMAVITSAGNEGPAESTITSPARSKNVIAVGALGSAASERAAQFSSRGPTEDGRIKPDIMAPGTGIISARGDSTSGNGNCSTSSKQGTSMASPITAGAAALLRQYFVDGYYPTGSKAPINGFEPSGVLVKATLLNGTFALPVGGTFGNEDYGWGRVFLDSNLYFEGDARDLRVIDLPNAFGMRTGQSHQYEIQVGEGEELRATLVWFDPEATPGAGRMLVNDLDLIVTHESTTYSGNSFDEQGNSVPGNAADSLNTVEQVRLSDPEPGTYSVAVRASNVPGTGRDRTDRQGYALVVSTAACGTGVVAPPTSLIHGTNPIRGVDLGWVSPPGATASQVYRAPAGTDDYRFIGSTEGSSITDDSAQGGFTYVYRIRGVDGCGEGPLSGSLTVSATGACDLKPEFAGVSSATANSPDCSVTLEWAPASSACPLGDGFDYNIYRSTTPDDFPSEPIATVADVTRFTDLSVESEIPYFYVVRAEERVAGGAGPNGGNEESNNVAETAVVVGPPGDLGTWIDDAGDISTQMTREFPWRIAEGAGQSGDRAYHAGIEGDTHPALTCAALTTPELMLGSGAVLTYWSRFNLEWEWDGVVVEISADGGASWTNLPPETGYPGTLALTQSPPVNACGYPATEGAFTGPSDNGDLTPWTEYSSDLSAYDGQRVRIRWRLTTDPGIEFEGFYLDTISITNVALPGSCRPVVVAPEAAFSILERSPMSGTPISFRDESEGNPQSWMWDFGDGVTSTEANPVHTYLQPGRYEVSLTVLNSSGDDTVSQSILIFDSELAYQVRSIVPGQARAAGGAGSFFRSAFWLTNLAANDSFVRLRYLPGGNNFGGADETVLLAIRPGESLAYQDVLTEAFGASTNTGGVIVVETVEGSPEPIVTARTYNEPSAFSGTFGQYIPAVPLIESSGLSLQIDGLASDETNRSNVGVANLSANAISAVIALFDPQGSPVGNPITMSLAPFSASQVNAAAASGAGALTSFSVRIDGTGPFFAYASKLDNRTSDPIFIPDSLRPLDEQWIDGVGATPGSGGTFFRSNLSIANRGATPANVTIDYFPRGSRTPVARETVTIPPFGTAFYNDALTELFSLSGAGMFRIATEESTPVVAWARTYNDRGVLGTLGQFIPGFGRANLIDSRGGLLQGLSDDAHFRTNAGLVNIQETDVGVTIEVWDSDGLRVGEQFHALAGGQTLFIPRALRAIAGRDVSDGYLIIRPATDGAIYGWASYVDNRSTDQTFVRPLVIP